MIERQRIVSLAGASNLRDLGGYLAEDGRTVRWRVLYRSAHLAGLTDADTAQFAALGLRTICDLRHDEERTTHPTPVVCTTACRVELLNLQPRLEPLVKELARTGRPAGIAPKELILSIYRAFALDHAEVYATLLERLADPSGLPLLFHCTAGKDRTGFGAALVLRALGVPMATVVADYLLTNDHWRGTGVLNDAPPEIRLVLGSARAEYLAASFEAIDERYGSLDGYLDRALGFEKRRVAALRDALLTADTAAAPA